jgi:anti-sigma factor RsiW
MTQLLAYVEGDLEDAARGQVEQHVKACPSCAEELAGLQRMHALLGRHPEAFHPDEEHLYRFVANHEDPSGNIAAHVQSCDSCSQDVELIAAMISHDATVERSSAAMPQEILGKLGQEAAPVSTGLASRLFSTMKELLGQPFRMPVLALGSAAAVLIVVAVCLPLWRSYQMERWLGEFRASEKLRLEHAVKNQQAGEALRDQDKLTSPLAKKHFRGAYPKANYVRPPAAGAQAPEAAPPVLVPEPRRDLHKSKGERVTPGQDAVATTKPSPAAPAVTFEAAPQGGMPAMSPLPAPTPQEKKNEMERQEVPSRETKRAVLGRVAPESLPRAAQLRAKKDFAGTGDRPAKGTLAPVPVVVHITDAQGNPVPWIEPRLPDSLEHRFHLIMSQTAKEETRKSKPLSSYEGLVDKKTEPAALLKVEIHVFPSNDIYDVDCKLFDVPSDREIASVMSVRKSRDEVPGAVNEALRNLLEHR